MSTRPATIGELYEQASKHYSLANYEQALLEFSTLVDLQPRHLDARLRIADCLRQLGKEDEARQVYQQLAHFSVKLGHPLKAIAALRLADPNGQSTQGPTAVRDIAEVYGAGSPHIGRGSRLATPDDHEKLPQTFELKTISDKEALFASAIEIGMGYDNLGVAFPQLYVPIPLFSLLPAPAFAAVAEVLKLVRVKQGDVVVQQGQPGDSLFVLVRGSVQVTRAGAQGEPTILATLGEGAMFGETALLSGAPRSATVHALSDCDLFEFPAEALKRAGEKMQTIAQGLAQFCQDRLLRGLLATAALFQKLNPKQREDLLKRFVAMNLPQDQVVIAEGEAGKGLFLVLRGQVRVSKKSENGEQEVALLSPGEVFGEIALVDDRAATATVTTTEPTGLLFLDKSYFQRLVQAVPEIREYIENLGGDRLLETQLKLQAEQEEPDAFDIPVIF